MIEYVEVRRKSDREIIGIVDGAKSIIWHSVYYGVGDFEIYAVASPKHVELLVEGNYITRPNDHEIGVIESVSSETNSDGTMLIVSGRFAKSILDRRHIYRLSGKQNQATILSGNVESAIRTVVKNNAIACSFDSSRNIAELELGALANIPTVIVDERGQAAQKQVSFDNLLDYTDKVLKEYELGAIVTLNDDTNKLQYEVYQGIDRSADNTDGNDPIVFSREYDNLTESIYKSNIAPKKTAALIGGEGEGLDRFYSLIVGTETGINRREMFVDGSSISKKYKDSSDTERTYTDAQYKAMLNAFGKQELAENIADIYFEGKINPNGGIWRLKEHYNVGDLVTFQNNTLGLFVNVRITELSEVQDENGYDITPVFDFK